MHKGFYASGFLYHPVSQQILLQRTTAQSPTWTLIGTLCKENDSPEIVLQEVMLLRLGIKAKKVFPIYSYSVDEREMSQYIGYAVTNKKPTFTTDQQFSWFSFKDITKLPIDDQTKHDIIVGQRVIEAADRKRLGLHTLQ